LSLFRYFEVGLRVCDIVVNKFTFAISSPDEFLSFSAEKGLLVFFVYFSAENLFLLSVVLLFRPKKEKSFSVDL